MRQYHDLVKRVLEEGIQGDPQVQEQRVFGHQMRFNLQDGFLVDHKKFILKVLHELLWFLQGSTNIEYQLKIGAVGTIDPCHLL